MGLLIKAPLDTTQGSVEKAYIRVESIQINRTTGIVRVAVTLWASKEDSDDSRKDIKFIPVNQIGNKIRIYKERYRDSGKDIEIPTYFIFSSKKPRIVRIPVYEEVEIPEEIPYLTFDDDGSSRIDYRTEYIKEKKIIGYQDDVNQDVSLDFESGLLSWIYGQIKSELLPILPPGTLVDDK